MNDGDLAELSEAIDEAARAAAAIVREAAPGAGRLDWEEKSAFDFVSAIDRAAEESIARELLTRFPGSIVLGEELTPTAVAGADLLFLVDPLDGTTNFLHGYPQYAVSIAASLDGRLLAGVVINAATGEAFTAISGRGALRDGQPMSVSTIHDPPRALIGTGFPFRRLEELAPYLRQFDLVARRTAGIRRAGSAALDLADVACGRFDAFWELSLSPWDVAAGLLLVHESGGVVTDLDGRPARPEFGGYIAGNPVMHAWLMRTLLEAEGD
jgi:myo-inositol-1(or 4)-monophosphatase